jgi:hypothetical protein
LCLVYTAIRLLFPIISLSWAIVSYDKKCCLIKGIKPDEGNRQGRMSILNDDAINCYKTFNWKKSAILFSANFFEIGKSKQKLILFHFVNLLINSCQIHRLEFVYVCFRLDCLAGLPCPPVPHFCLAPE